MTAAEIAKEFAGYIGSDDPEWVAKLGNRLQERIEALVAELRDAITKQNDDAWKFAAQRNEATACVQRLAVALQSGLGFGQIVGGSKILAREALASIPAHLLAKEEVKP